MVPVFDKSLHDGDGDRSGVLPEKNIDIILFEGWFVGLRPLEDNKLLEELIPPINNEKDVQFAKDISVLLGEYVPLWDMLDQLIALVPENFEYTKLWRKDAERKMKEKTGRGKTDKEIEDFMDYFWKALHPKIYFPRLFKEKGAFSYAAFLNENHLLQSYIINAN